MSREDFEMTVCEVYSKSYFKATATVSAAADFCITFSSPVPIQRAGGISGDRTVTYAVFSPEGTDTDK